jgi:Aspartyl/Asparaginyl beta-hydroxylase
MRNFHMMSQGADVGPLQMAIHRQPWLWNQHRMRKDTDGSPHLPMDDIWLRYNDWKNWTGDHEAFTKREHESVWYPAYYALPQVKPMIFGLMAAVDGERLGGALITRVPAGREIAPHKDGGWHVDYYEKFYVQIANPQGCIFECEGEQFEPRQGDVYWFDNRKLHSIKNDGSVDRMTLIVCIKCDRFKGAMA